MNVEKVKKFSAKNAGKIVNLIVDASIGSYCLFMAGECVKAGLEDASVGVLIVAGLAACAKAIVESGALGCSYSEFQE